MRDPANELYDQACSLLDAAQGLRAAASVRDAAPALAASLGCIEEALHELRETVPEFRDTALRADENCEPLQIRASFAVLARDLSASRSSCAGTRRLVGPTLARR